MCRYTWLQGAKHGVLMVCLVACLQQLSSVTDPEAATSEYNLVENIHVCLCSTLLACCVSWRMSRMLDSCNSAWPSSGMSACIEGPHSAGASPQTLCLGAAAAATSVWHSRISVAQHTLAHVLPQTMGVVLQRLTNGRQPTRILCCGHSLGGAVAILSEQRPVDMPPISHKYVRLDCMHKTKRVQRCHAVIAAPSIHIPLTGGIPRLHVMSLQTIKHRRPDQVDPTAFSRGGTLTFGHGR